MGQTPGKPNVFLAAVDLVTEAATVEAAESGEPFETVYERKWKGVMDELRANDPATLAKIERQAGPTLAATGLLTRVA